MTLDAPQFRKPCRFLVDTASELNIIKVSSIRPDVTIVPEHTVQVQGITDGTIRTLGIASAELKNSINIVFHVFPDVLSDNIDGILGSPFFRDGGEISFAKRRIFCKNICIPFDDPLRVHTIEPRSAACITLDVNGPDTGSLPRVLIEPNVFLGDCLVTNIEGKTCLRCVNASTEVATFSLPVLEVEEFEAPFFSPEPRPVTVPASHELYPPCAPEPSHVPTSALSSTDISVRVQELLESIPTQHLNSDETAHVHSLLLENHDLFHLQDDRLGKTNAVTHKIPTTDNTPVHTKQYRYPPIHKDEINKQMSALLANKVVVPSNSPYNSPLWIVPKKPDENGNKKWRMVIDYRALNEKSVADAYPLPSINEILDQLGNARYFSVLDLASGFHQIGMEPEDAAKTAFSTPFGHYQYNRMPFGLKKRSGNLSKAHGQRSLRPPGYRALRIFR